MPSNLPRAHWVRCRMKCLTFSGTSVKATAVGSNRTRSTFCISRQVITMSSPIAPVSRKLLGPQRPEKRERTLSHERPLLKTLHPLHCTDAEVVVLLVNPHKQVGPGAPTRTAPATCVGSK
jgi:hypothetical protein